MTTQPAVRAGSGGGRARRLKILQCIPILGIGGAERVAAQLAAGLSVSHDAAVLCLYPPTNSPFERQLQSAGVRAWYLGKHPGFDMRMLPAVDRVIREFGPDVVHTHISAISYVLPWALVRSVPLIVHTVHTLAGREADRFGRLLRRIALGRWVVPVAVSREVARTVERRYGTPCDLVPNGIPLAEHERSPKERARWRAEVDIEAGAVLYIFVGRLAAPKNLMLLLKAFSELECPSARLALVGCGDERPHIEAFIERHTMRANVRVLGHRDDVPACLAAADVFVLSSHWEGSPVALMEAMAAALPVVSTAVGGIPELVESGREGILVPPGDACAFTAALKHFADDPRSRRAMGEAARARARSSFGVERMVAAYESLYMERSAARRRTAMAAGGER